MVNLRQIPAQSVDVEVNVNVAPEVDKRNLDAVPEDDDDWNFECVIVLEDVERVGVKRNF